MTTIIERDVNGDSSGAWAVLVVVLIAVIGFGLAYFNGAFPGLNSKPTVIEHNTTINRIITVPAPTTPAPAQ